MAISITEVPAEAEDTQMAVAARSHERDADQLAMDERVKVLAGEWVAAGKPEQKNSPYRRLGVPKDQRSELKRLIRRGAVINGYEPLYWQDTKPNADGIVHVKFTVGAKKVKATDNGSGTPTATDTPTPPAGTGDEGGEQPQTEQRRGAFSRR